MRVRLFDCGLKRIKEVPVHSVSIFQFPVGCDMTENIWTNKAGPRFNSSSGGALKGQGRSSWLHCACSADLSDKQEVKLSVSRICGQV